MKKLWIILLAVCCFASNAHAWHPEVSSTCKQPDGKTRVVFDWYGDGHLWKIAAGNTGNTNTNVCKRNGTKTKSSNCKNYFSPSPKDIAQPTIFPRGNVKSFFTTTFSGSSLLWRVGPSTASAHASSKDCPLPPVSPVLECVNKLSNTSFVAYFGYNNTNGKIINVPVGNSNKFTPSPIDRSQPTAFQKGRQAFVFSVPFNGSNLVWSLTGKTATASKSSKSCNVDCAGVPNGHAVVDECGVCGGDNSTCKDCKGVPNGNTIIDQCGVCGGDNSTCLDCQGTPNGDTIIDQCGVCGGDNSTCKDCKGVPNGHAVVDECGVCGGQNTTCKDCAGVPNGHAVVDECGVCGGDNSTCLDCQGTPNGHAVVDECGVCNGTNDCVCDWADVCGVPCGDGTTCLDCQGTPNGHAVVDECGVCDYDASNDNACFDCAGAPNGGATVDPCGICNGDGSSCRTCGETDITSPKVIIDHNSLLQYRLIRKALRRVLRGGKAKQKVAAKALLKQADHYHMSIWTYAWTFESIQVEHCTNTFHCKIVDNTATKNSIKSETKELTKLLRKSIRLAERAKKLVHRKAQKLRKRNRKLVKITARELKKIPTHHVDC